MAQDLNRSIKIYIDNSDAMASATKLEGKIEKLRESIAKLAAEGKKNTDEYDKEKKALDKYVRSYGNYQKTIKDTERVLKNLSGSTYKELQSTKKILLRELKEETRGTEKYTTILKHYHTVQKQIAAAQKEMNSGLGSQGTLMSRAANGFNKYFGMLTTGLATLTGISFTLRKLSQDAAEMEDVYADVMKTTGLTREEVGKLNDELKKINTRTSREELNMLARDAGKLGITAQKDILGFVEAGNQINVALGEDLGEGAIRNIGKITEVFRLSTKELDQMDLKGRMLSIGSAINELGQSSTANEQYLVNFTQRLGGVASQAGISVQNILGYASALDQSGQAVEMSATALQQFIMTLMEDPAKFARLAGIEVEGFNKLLQTDTNEAIKTVLRSLSEKGGFQQLIPVFKEMGLDGARAVGVLSALATNIDKVDEAQGIANKSFAEAVSLTNEYNVKNENAQAELEKRRKAFRDAAEELGRRLNPAILKSTNYVTYLVKLLPGLLDFLAKYGKYVLYLATAYAVYTSAVKLHTKWQAISHGWTLKELAAYYKSEVAVKMKTAAIHLSRIAMIAYSGAVALVTGNLTKARKAWNLLKAAMATNPIGLIAVATAAAVTGIVKLVQWLNRTTAAAKAVKEATKQYNSELQTETREAKALFDALKKTNPESNTHLQIRKEIISRYGKYLQGLVDEKGNITDIAGAITAVNNGLREQIALKIRNQSVDTIMEESLNRQTDITDKIMKRIGKQVSSEVVRSSIRETINRTVSEFTSSGGSDYAKLQRKLLSDIQGTYGVDAYKGVFNVKNLVEDLVGEVKKSGQALDEVEQKFSGMISKYTDVKSLITLDPEDPDPTVTPQGNEDVYKEELKVLEAYIAKERALIQEKYIEGLVSREQYERQLEYLEMERLRKNLELAGISFEQQKEIELKIFETKQKMLQQIRDEETEHQRQLAAIQEKADKARAENNWNTLKAIAKQNEENYKKEFERENKRKADLIAIGMNFSSEMGELLGGALSFNEDIVASSLRNIINMGLDLLKVQVQMAVAGATAQSLAQADSVATFGASGLARAAILVGLIESAFAAVKSVVGSVIGNIGSSNNGDSTPVTGSRVVTQRAAGKYDVIGADDGRLYRGVPYAGSAATGYVSTPTLVGEQGRELIISAPDLTRLQRHINYPLIIRAINDVRAGVVPQRAAGNYTQVSQSMPASTPGNADMSLLADVRDLLRKLSNEGLPAFISLTDLQRKQDLLNKSRKIGSK